MQDFVIVKTFTYIHELDTARVLLESNNIPTIVKDELTVQTNPLYSNAVGGIKLLVHREDTIKARQLLGMPAEDQTESSKTVGGLGRLILKLSAAGKSTFIRITGAVMIVGMIVYFLTRPSLEESLKKGEWCLKEMTYQNSRMKFSESDESGCKGFVDFTTFEVEIPTPLWDRQTRLTASYGTAELEFNVSMNWSSDANWELSGDQLIISEPDRSFEDSLVKDVLYGTYDIDMDGRNLILKSDKTTLRCYNVGKRW